MFNVIFLTDNALRLIESELSSCKRVETGGALVGYYSDEAIVVTHATGPGPRGKRTASSVLVDGKFTTEFCRNLSIVSNGHLYYVGDWHVHPNGILVPSSIDRQASRILIQSNASPLSCIAYLIFSTSIESLRAYKMSSEKEIEIEIEIKKCSTPKWVIPFI